MSPPQTRKFNGKTYRVIHTAPTKTAENRVANKYREKGFNVRLVHTEEGWVAYARRRE